jgi:ParB/RepB/Spo0J family partition protein
MKGKEPYQEVLLNNIAPNPLNPRKEFGGVKFDELVASVEVKGVIVPILLRPMTDKRKKQEFEIVFGERRWRAAMAVGEKNGGVKKATIPAIVKDLTDEEAFDAMTIENLQREDLTELEEAQSFKTYLDKKGKDGLPELATRLGIHPRYIQRRVAVLELPKPALKAWEEGKIKYGHCEQLMRLKDPGEIKNCLKELLEYNQWRGQPSVHELQISIDNNATELAWAKFNIEEEGCLACRHNSDVQREMFGDVTSTKTTHCLDSSCFKSKQGKWLTKNWKKFAKQAGTNGFRFAGTIKYNEHNEFEEWSRQPGEKCSGCPDFVSIVSLRGKTEHKQSCVGKKSCYDSMPAATRKRETKKTRRGEQSEAAPKEGPRVDWHGAFFREEFYHERIQAVLSARGSDDPDVLRTALFSILKSNDDAKIKFAKDRKIIREDQNSFHVSLERLWSEIAGMYVDKVRENLQIAATRIVLQSNHFSSMLSLIADHLKISLADEWRLNRSYLDKKTIGEIHEIGEKLGIFADEKAQTFLFETLGKKRGKFTTCKKEELIRVILESGVDLAGKVPAEILDLRTRTERLMEADGETVCPKCKGECYLDEDCEEECPDCKGEGTIAAQEAVSA